jgi:hypothetical protein
MRCHIIAAAFVLSSLLPSGAAQAQQEPIRLSLYRQVCSIPTNGNPQQDALCGTYITGLVEGMQYATILNASAAVVCIPRGMKREEITARVIEDLLKLDLSKDDPPLIPGLPIQIAASFSCS